MANQGPRAQPLDLGDGPQGWSLPPGVAALVYNFRVMSSTTPATGRVNGSGLP